MEMEGSGLLASRAQASSASPGLAAARTLEPGEQALLASPGPQAARTLGNYIQESNHTSYTSGKSSPKNCVKGILVWSKGSSMLPNTRFPYIP